MKVNEIMTSSPCVSSSAGTVGEVARLMRDYDCGAVPIVDNGRLVGIVTDRDLAIRALAEGLGADAKAGDIMTVSPQCATPGDDVRDVEKLMTDHQVRRVPIVDADGSCLGIVSQADLARASKNESVSDREVAIVLEAISEPSGFQSRSAMDNRL